MPFYHSFSDPLVLATKYESDRIVEVLTHELIHRLLTDNTDNHYLADFSGEWRKFFGDGHSKNTLVHIPVHAVMQAVFDDYICEPEGIVRDKQEYKNYPDYAAAWAYVDRVGYKTIISQLRRAMYLQPTDE